MPDPQSRQRFAQELIRFGPNLSGAGLSYLKAQQHQEQIDEADRVAKAKVLKEKLAEAEMIGRNIAAKNPKMSIVSQVLAMQRNVGLTTDNPNFQKIIDATNEGFLLKRAEVGLAGYNAQLKSTAPLAAEELYQNYLKAQKPTIETGPTGEDIEQEGFDGTLIEYAAQHIEELRVATIGNLISHNKGQNRFSVILAKPGNRLNYDTLKTEIAKKQEELDDQALLNDALGSVKEEVKEIVIQGTTTGGGDPMVPGLVQHSSGQSLKHVIQSLKDRGLENEKVNYIIYTSLRSGLETQVENRGISLLDTNYFDNIVELLHSKESDPEGISLYEKDKQAGQQLLTKVREYEKKLNDEFEAGTKKTTKSEEDELANDATMALELVIKNASKVGVTSEEIAQLRTEIYTNQSKGDLYGGMMYMDDSILTKIMNHLEILRVNAEKAEKTELTEGQKEIIAKADQSIVVASGVLNSTPLLNINKKSTEAQFQKEIGILDRTLESLKQLGSGIGKDIGYGWEGAKTFQSKIEAAQKQIREAKKGLFTLRAEGSDETTKRGVALRLEVETTEYNTEIVQIKQRDEPTLSKIFFEMKQLSTNSADTTSYKEYIKTYTNIINQTKTKPIGVNKLGSKILYEEVFVFSEKTRASFRGDLRVIEKARRDDDSEDKIIINPQDENDFHVKISKGIRIIDENVKGKNFEERTEALRGLLLDTQNAYDTNQIGGVVFKRLESQLDVGIKDIKLLIDKNYGSIKIFDDSKKKLNRSITGETGEGIVIGVVNQSDRKVYGVFEEEHNRLQDHLIDVSQDFDQRKLVPETKTSKERTVSQANMFSSGVSIYNKRIRNLAFLTHRNLMFGRQTPEEVLKDADKMEGTGKWSDEEIQIIREVAGFESYPGVIGHLQKGYKNIKDQYYL